MISLKNLSKSFILNGERYDALRDINLNIDKGEIFGIIGKSGAGKSTLIRCLNRLEEPDTGSIMVNNMDVCEMKRANLRLARRQMSMIFQHFNLLTRRTVFENISLPLELEGNSRASITERVESLLELTDLTEHRDKYPSQLSGGQKQRVAIARALAPSPKVLLSDEATSALDPTSTNAILELLRSINKELGITIVLITHEMEVVKAICDKVAIIDKGEIVESGTVLNVFTQPKTEVAKSFVDATTRVDVPPNLKKKLKDKPTATSSTVIKIAYHGETASQPIIGFLIQKYHITVNMLQGNIELIHGETVGIMIVEIKGSQEHLVQSIDFLERNNLYVEILGHIDE